MCRRDSPNPTVAVGIRDSLTDRTVINVPGCPPIGDVITAVIMYILTFDRAPEMCIRDKLQSRLQPASGSHGAGEKMLPLAHQ